jgi:hypothetical protein
MMTPVATGVCPRLYDYKQEKACGLFFFEIVRGGPQTIK